MDEQRIETTLYSLSDDPPGPTDRRDGDRHVTLFRVGSILLEDRRELCLIKNISAGGMMIRLYCAATCGRRVSVELKSGQPIAGRISWVRELNVGVSFDQPVDVIDILSSSMDGPRPRMPRIEVHSSATVRDGATVTRHRVDNISQGGIRVQASAGLIAGNEVIVALPGIETQPGVVRWCHDGLAGITFNRLIALPQLVAWLEQQRSGLRAATG